jgi:hypothetical protein
MIYQVIILFRISNQINTEEAMTATKAHSVIRYVTCILVISFLTMGGCDIEFSSDDDDGNNGGNGDQEAILSGNITSIIPERNLDGIIVEIEDEDTGVLFRDVTDTNGFFEIEGGFSGSPARLEFINESLEQIALTSVTVFPGAEVDLGDLTINEQTVTFEDDIIVVLEGDVTEINCSESGGTLEVTADDIDVIVQISSSTDIIRDDEDLECEDLLVGDDVRVRGPLDGTNIEADLIELL